MKRTAIIVILLFWGCVPRVSAQTSAETAGDILQVALPAVAYGMTFVYDDPQGRTQFYKSFFSTLGTTYALKLVVDKERPDGGKMSFPSGHTSSAFSGASFIQRRYGWKYGMPAYAAALFVGWSRIDSDAHYVEDVVAGAAIGIAFSAIFTTPFDTGIAIVPELGEDAFGVLVCVRF